MCTERLEELTKVAKALGRPTPFATSDMVGREYKRTNNRTMLPALKKQCSCRLSGSSENRAFESCKTTESIFCWTNVSITRSDCFYRSSNLWCSFYNSPTILGGPVADSRVEGTGLKKLFDDDKSSEKAEISPPVLTFPRPDHLPL